MRPAFASKEQILARAESKQFTLEAYARYWFEKFYDVPSLGHPAFKEHPIPTILEHLIRVQLWKGKVVKIDEGGMFLFFDQEEVHIDEKTGARITGDPLVDGWEKMIMEGKNPFTEEMKAVSRVGDVPERE